MVLFKLDRILSIIIKICVVAFYIVCIIGFVILGIKLWCVI